MEPNVVKLSFCKRAEPKYLKLSVMSCYGHLLDHVELSSSKLFTDMNKGENFKECVVLHW